MLLSAREAATATYREHDLINTPKWQSLEPFMRIKPGSIIPHDRMPLFRHNEVAVRAFFRPILRKGIDITELRNNGSYGSCTFVIGEDVIGNMRMILRNDDVYINIILQVFDQKNREVECIKKWKRRHRKRGKTIKSRNRPKYRKFGAYVAKKLIENFKKHAVIRTMET